MALLCAAQSSQVNAGIIHENLRVSINQGPMPTSLQEACTIRHHNYLTPFATCIAIENTSSENISLILSTIFWDNVPPKSWMVIYSDWEYDLRLVIKDSELSTTLFNDNADIIVQAGQNCTQTDCKSVQQRILPRVLSASFL